MKRFCEFLREHAMKIINFKKKKKKEFINKRAKICYVCKEKFENKYLKYKKIVKLEIIVIIQGNKKVLRIAYLIKNIVFLKQFV